jgi:predicted permease
VTIGQVGRSFVLYSHDLYQHLRSTDVFVGLCAFDSGEDSVVVRRAGGPPQIATSKLVSGNYFHVLGVNAAVGRTIGPADDSASARPVAVVSFRYWKDILNEDASAIGETLNVNGVPVAIVGVAPPGFYGERIEPDPPSFWLPIATSRALKPEANLVDEPGQHWLYLMGRLRPDVTARQAETRLTLALQNWIRTRQAEPQSAERQQRIANSRVELNEASSGIPHLQRRYSQTLRLLLGISAAVLLLASTNIAGLLLARGMGQRTERSVRLALGASRGRLVRQSLAESLTLALAGGVLAVLVAAAAARLLVAMVFDAADYVPIRTTPDARALAFTFAVTCASALAVGLLPAIRMRSDVAPSLRGVRFRMGKAIVIGQVAASLAVLAGAGALVFTLVNLTRQPFGFERSQVLVVNVDPRLAQYDYDRLAPLYQQLDSRLNALPGVRSASFSSYSPFNGCCWGHSVSVPGYTPGPDEDTVTLLNRVSPRYFQTLGTKLLRGRTLREDDTPISRRVIVVNEAFARRYFPDDDPVGRIVNLDSDDDVDQEIVGVVESTKYDEPRDAVRPMIFLPFLQMQAGVPASSGDYQSNFINAIEVRAASDPAGMAESIRQTLAEIAPDLPVLRVETLSDQVAQTLGQERVTATLAVFFGLVALILTCVGLYGVMAYLIQRRTREIGVRIALGAARGTVIGMMIREALEQAFVGILVGTPAAFTAIRLFESRLYGVSPTNPQNVAVATLVLTACLGLAAYLPARRASRLDPNAVLRAE